MSAQETKQTEESQIGGNLDAAGSASGALGANASASSKKTEERKKPKKLGQKAPNGETPNAEANEEVDADASPKPAKMSQSQSRPQSRQPSRGRGGRGQSQPPSDTDSAYRSDVSQKGSRRNRNRNRGKGQQAQAQSQAQTQQEGKGGLLGGDNPLGAVDEVGETVNGVVDGVGDTVSNTAGKALSAPHEALGGLLHSKKGNQDVKGQDGEEKDEGENEQLRLRLDLNLEIEVQLKARIHGDLTLGLLYVTRNLCLRTLTNIQELVLKHHLNRRICYISVTQPKAANTSLGNCAQMKHVVLKSLGDRALITTRMPVAYLCLRILCMGNGIVYCNKMMICCFVPYSPKDYYSKSNYITKFVQS